ncbi:MAG: ATP-dependent Clp protease proteolytic subunit [Halanaerobiales bacterium]|nr:ATP-dependent Clp protease proteolytic subunit [Halanaerobiales bacterium]
MTKQIQLLAEYGAPISEFSISPIANSGDGSPTIWLNDFSEEDVREFFRKFNSLQSDDQIQAIAIYIDSYGGSVDSLAAICELVENSTKPIITVAIGKAMSAGAMLFALGTPGMRYIGSMTSLMYHRLQITDIDGDIELASSMIKEVLRENEIWMKKIIKSSKMNWTEFNKKLQEKGNHWFLGAKEAIKYGFADHIGIPTLRETHQLKLVI